MLRSYAGGVKEVTLTAPMTDLATSATVSNLLGVPDGSNGPFSVVIGKGTPNEEKVLVSTAGGGGLTFSQRGYDGTVAQPHAVGEEVRMVITSIDAAEANAHVNASTAVHGLDLTDTVAGVNAAQTFLNKTISGLNNDLSNIDPDDSPLLVAAFADEEAARLAGDGVRYTKTEADLLFPTFAASQAYTDNAVLDHTEAADPHIQYLMKTQAATDYLPLVNGGLAPADVPEAHSGRFWSDPLVSRTATDVDPEENIAAIVIPAATGPGQAGGSGDRLFLVTGTVKGFTTNGTSGDTCRFGVFIVENTGGSWLGLTGDGSVRYPTANGRMEGGVSVPAEGVSVVGILRVPFGVPSTIVFGLRKISGGCNPTNSADDGSFTAVQLV